MWARLDVVVLIIPVASELDLAERNGERRETTSFSMGILRKALVLVLPSVTLCETVQNERV